AVAAARGTYFVVWSQGGSSGIVNIGNSGRVDFMSGGQTVSVSPSQFSSAPAGAPPAPAVAVTATGTPAIVTAAIQSTTFANSPVAEAPNAVVQALVKAKALTTTTTTPVEETKITTTTEETKSNSNSNSSKASSSTMTETEKTSGKSEDAKQKSDNKRTTKLLDRAAKDQGRDRTKQGGPSSGVAV